MQGVSDLKAHRRGKSPTNLAAKLIFTQGSVGPDSWLKAPVVCGLEALVKDRLPR